MSYEDQIFGRNSEKISRAKTHITDERESIGGGMSGNERSRSEQTESELSAGFEALLTKLKHQPEDLHERIQRLKSLPDADHILEKLGSLLTEEHWEMLATLEAYDQQTFDHSLRVSAFVYDMASGDGQTAAYLRAQTEREQGSLQDLMFAALFHDIGKTAIPREILHDNHSRREWGRRANEWAAERNEPEYFDPTKLASLDEVELDDYFFRIHALEKTDPLNIVPIEKFFDPVVLKELEQHGISAQDTFRKVLEYHQRATKAILRRRKMYIASDIASHHHDYEDRPIRSERYSSEISALRLGFELSILRSMDVYDALTSSDRTYKNPYHPLLALEILIREAEIEFTEPTLTKYVVCDLYNKLNASQKNPTNENETRALQKILSFIEN